MDSNKYAPPTPSTFEVSVFGSVVGECIVVHLPSGDWVIVDSCIHASSRRPAALHYLEAMGIDPGTSVKLIVLTHWHDDHISGAAEIVDRCPVAKLVFPQAMESDEFVQLLSTYAKPDFILDRESSALKELKRVMEIVQRRVKQKLPFAHPEFASSNKLLFNTASGKAIALSPSNRAIGEAHAEFAQLVSEGRANRRVPVARERNPNAIALWIGASGYRALLGSDLEESRHVDDGWQAVLKCLHFPDGSAGIFKIPHHGSANGHSNDVWTQVVRAGNAIAALTTYVRGVRLPKPTDVTRIKGKTNTLFCTTPVSEAVPKRDPTVDRTMKETVTDRRTLRGRITGHIRIRVDTSKPTHPEQIDLFDAAHPL